MKQIDDIIEAVTVKREPVADTLRRCLVIAYRLKNDVFKTWVESELNGYPDNSNLPDYRVGKSIALGYFHDGFGSFSNNQPIAVHLMDEKHRHWATDVNLGQPIAAYGEGEVEDIAFAWPPTLTAYYQSKLMQGMYLNRAWLPVPPSMLVGLVDTVKTRILTFALEIQSELPEDDSKGVETIPQSVVNRIVNVTIMGNNNIVGDYGTIEVTMVDPGDVKGLTEAVKEVGLTDEDAQELETILQSEPGTAVATTGEQSLGEKTLRWIARNAGKAAHGGVKIGQEVATKILTDIIKGFLGL